MLTAVIIKFIHVILMIFLILSKEWEANKQKYMNRYYGKFSFSLIIRGIYDHSIFSSSFKGHPHAKAAPGHTLHDFLVSITRYSAQRAFTCQSHKSVGFSMPLHIFSIPSILMGRTPSSSNWGIGLVLWKCWFPLLNFEIMHLQQFWFHLHPCWQY